MELFESNKVFKRLLRQTSRGGKGSLGGDIWDWRIGGGGGVRRRGSRLGGLGLITSGGSRLLSTRLVAGGAVELTLAASCVFWRLRLAFVLRLVLLLSAGVDHLHRVLALLWVHPEPLCRHFLAAFSPLGHEDAGIRVLGDGRRTLDKGALHGLQLGLGF